MELAALTQQLKDRENLRQLTTARLAAMVANMMSDKSSRRFSQEDFLPFAPPRRYLTVDEADMMFAKQFGVGGKAEIRKAES